ncbi:MAG: hypothetical protein JWN48_475 [Myxococcaceae bacterium]|nr:hypothetical protein [Myxococcaceae bacterium]
MHEGFDITFREVMPESSIVELVIAQLATLRGLDDRHCSVVLRRHERALDEFAAHVQFEREWRGDALHGQATAHDPHEAVARAFADLRDHQLLH